jgi:hypothetical protein
VSIRIKLALACLVVSVALVVSGTVMSVNHSFRMRVATTAVSAYTKVGLPAPQAAVDKMFATGVDPTGIYLLLAGAAVASLGKVLTIGNDR